MSWWVLLALPAVSPQTIAAWIDDAVAGRSELPSLAAVQAAAVRALRLTPEGEVDGWSRRLRRRGWVPRLETKLGTNRNLDVRDALDVDDRWTRVARGLGVDVALRWNLSDLVFADLELRANRERIARSTEVRLARERVTELYFERVEIWVRMRLEPTATLALEAARLDGRLAALTGGLLHQTREP